jgi:hypothetical protein
MADVTGTYYAGEAIVGYGAELLVGDGASPASYEAVADVISITPGEMTTAVIDKTHLRSPDRHREKIATLRDSGPFVIRANWRPSHESQSKAGGGSGSFTAGGLVQKWINVSEEDFLIRLNDGSPPTEFPFRGTVTRFQPGEVTVDNKIEVSIEITPLRDFSASLP